MYFSYEANFSLLYKYWFVCGHYFGMWFLYIIPVICYYYQYYYYARNTSKYYIRTGFICHTTICSILRTTILIVIFNAQIIGSHTFVPITFIYFVARFIAICGTDSYTWLNRRHKQRRWIYYTPYYMVCTAVIFSI